jgi:hypothetical protein
MAASSDALMSLGLPRRVDLEGYQVSWGYNVEVISFVMYTSALDEKELKAVELFWSGVVMNACKQRKRESCDGSCKAEKRKPHDREWSKDAGKVLASWLLGRAPGRRLTTDVGKVRLEGRQGAGRGCSWCSRGLVVPSAS